MTGKIEWLKKDKKSEFVAESRRFGTTRPPPDPGTLGEVKTSGVSYRDWYEGAERIGVKEPRCVIFLCRELDAASTWKQRATVAHELGHVAVTPEVFARRNAPHDEWANEASADWFACRWGFRADLGCLSRERDFVHHGPWTGQIVETDIGRGTQAFRLTRNFVFHETASGS